MDLFDNIQKIITFLIGNCKIKMNIYNMLNFMTPREVKIWIKNRFQDRALMHWSKN